MIVAAYRSSSSCSPGAVISVGGHLSFAVDPIQKSDRTKQARCLLDIAVGQCPHRHMINAVPEAGHREARLAVVAYRLEQMSARFVCVVAGVGSEAEDLRWVCLGDGVSGLGAEQAESLRPPRTRRNPSTG